MLVLTSRVNISVRQYVQITKVPIRAVLKLESQIIDTMIAAEMDQRTVRGRPALSTWSCSNRQKQHGGLTSAGVLQLGYNDCSSPQHDDRCSAGIPFIMLLLLVLCKGTLTRVFARTLVARLLIWSLVIE